MLHDLQLVDPSRRPLYPLLSCSSTDMLGYKKVTLKVEKTYETRCGMSYVQTIA